MVTTASLSWWHVFLFIGITMFLVYIAEYYQSKFFFLIASFIMIAVSGLRHGYIDTRAYRVGFETLNISSVLNLDFLLNGESKDRGFSVISAIIKLFSQDSQVFLFVFALITVGCLLYGIERNSVALTFSVFLFICTGCYLDTMNGMRQAFVSAILFAVGSKLIEEKKVVKYIILVLLLSTVHASALLFIPLYFVADKKAWSSYTWVISGVTLVVFVFFNSGIGSFIVSILEDTSYGADYGQMILTANTSVNVLRLLVALVPIGLSVITKEYEEKDFPFYHICFNMSLVNALTWLFATKVLYFYRLAAYFQPYMILLLGYELYFIRGESNRKIIKTFAIIMFLLWHAYSLYVMGEQFFVGYLKY